MRDIPSGFPQAQRSLFHPRPHPGRPHVPARKQNPETLSSSPDGCHKTRKPLTVKHHFIHIWSSCRPEKHSNFCTRPNRKKRYIIFRKFPYCMSLHIESTEDALAELK
ncbi:hypothetical protein, partial [Akkermansia sp.]|uniref:hypothetical protein n=1 Tax=Akkermansia sp. TaxID=1872421 RepID=UPI0025BF8517